MLAGLAVAPLVVLALASRAIRCSGLVLAVVMLFKLNLALLAVAPVRRARPRSRAQRIALARSSAGALGWGRWTLAAAGCPRCSRRAARLPRHDRLQRPLRERPERFGGTRRRSIEHLRVARRLLRARGSLAASARDARARGVRCGSRSCGAARQRSAAGTRPPSRLRRCSPASSRSVSPRTGSTISSCSRIRPHASRRRASPSPITAGQAGRSGRRCGVRACSLSGRQSRTSGGLEVSRAWTSTPISAGAIALERARLASIPKSRGSRTWFSDRTARTATRRSSARSSISLADGSTSIRSSDREQFDETLACVEREEPRLVLVTLGFFETGADEVPWAEFVSSSRRLLERALRARRGGASRLPGLEASLIVDRPIHARC